MSKDFVHLHNHTEYSMLDGAAKIGELFEQTKNLGMNAVATTDHGFIFGAYEFWKTAQQYDVRPIIGLEAYLTPGTHRTDRSRVRFGDRVDDVSGAGAYTHMTMWAESTTGMHNLFRASSWLRSRAISTSLVWTARFSRPTARGSSPPPGASPERFRRGCVRAV